MEPPGERPSLFVEPQELHRWMAAGVAVLLDARERAAS